MKNTAFLPKNITEVYNNDRKTIVVQNVFPIFQT